MREMEKDMNQKLERELVTNSILSQQIMEWEKRAEDSDRIIQKFRQKITELNEKVEEQKDEVCFYSLTFLIKISVFVSRLLNFMPRRRSD